MVSGDPIKTALLKEFRMKKSFNYVVVVLVDDEQITKFFGSKQEAFNFANDYDFYDIYERIQNVNEMTVSQFLKSSMMTEVVEIHSKNGLLTRCDRVKGYHSIIANSTLMNCRIFKYQLKNGVSILFV